ncbi:Pentatricopeptide repeat-containing protein 1, mitochondrial [Batrachochytrium dendrobatidis]|nr:Pentatricopeptide repeat-containing protein 1, mitochondrial [Batrachochytrium dendrobatidis]
MMATQYRLQASSTLQSASFFSCQTHAGLITLQYLTISHPQSKRLYYNSNNLTTSHLPCKPLKSFTVNDCSKPSYIWREKSETLDSHSASSLQRNNHRSSSDIYKSYRKNDPNSHCSYGRLLNGLIVAVEHREYRSAISTFRRLEKEQPDQLKMISPMVYQVVIRAIAYNLDSSAFGMTPQQRAEYVVKVFCTMQEYNVEPDFRTFLTAIYAYGQLKDLERVRQVYAQMGSRGWTEYNKELILTMCKACIECGQESEGLQYFSQLWYAHRTIEAYNLLIRAYACIPDEPGLFSTLELMQNAKIKPNAATMILLCKFYIKRKDLKTFYKHIDLFKQHNGKMNAQLYYLLMQCENMKGDHLRVLDLFEEMNTAGIEQSSLISAELVTAYANLGNLQPMLQQYCLAAKFHTVTPTSQTAMAKAFGSIKSVDSVDQITATAIHSGISPFGIVYDLINGFRNLGDGESIKYLIRWLEERDQRVVMATYRHLVMAYHIAEDFDNAWKCTKELYDRFGDKVTTQIWFTILKCAVMYRTEAIQEVSKYILERVENYPIEAAILAGEEELRTGVQVKYSNLVKSH